MKRLETAAILMVIGVSCLMAGCSPNRVYSDLPSSVPEYTQGVYQIGVGDQLHVMVWKNPDLSINVPVRPDGKISVPLVGDVFASGKSADALAKQITKELENYIRTPQVTVVVTGANSTEFVSRVRITGAVNGPMSVPYKKGMTVLDLVLLSGGVSEFSDANEAKLYRVADGGIKVHPVYLDDILKGGDVRSNYTLMPSDIITVPEKVF